LRSDPGQARGTGVYGRVVTTRRSLDFRGPVGSATGRAGSVWRPIPETCKIGERGCMLDAVAIVLCCKRYLYYMKLWCSGPDRDAAGARAHGRSAADGRRALQAGTGVETGERGVHDVAGWATAWLDLGIPVCARAATELPATAAARAFMWLSSRTRCRQRATAHSPEIAKSSARCASRVARSISLKQGFSSIWPLLMAARRTPSMPTAVHRPEMSPSSIRSSLRRAR